MTGVLILFDIDLTLIDSGGAGMRSMVAAGQRLHGPAFSAEGIPFGGQLDPVILRRMLERAGVEPSAGEIRRVREAYHGELESTLASGAGARALPGVLELLGELERHASAPTLGLLTGNFEETGRLKLRSAGLEADRFAVRVWGDESPHEPPLREHLPPVGMARCGALRGAAIPPDRVVVVGDTERDVHAARTNGCRSLAVATGRVSAGRLSAAGADRVVDDLSDIKGVLEWLVNP